MKLTLDEVIENHKKMWNWIANKTESQRRKIYKDAYFEENRISEYILHDCFCCHFAQDSGFPNCDMCPIDWGIEHIPYACEDFSTYYSKWYHAEDWQSAAQYARQIANLAVRLDEMKC